MMRSQGWERIGRRPRVRTLSLLIAALISTMGRSGSAEELSCAAGALGDGVEVHGAVEAGGEPLSVEHREGKFGEYRDIPENAVLNEVRVRGEHADRDYFLDFRVEDAIQEDQRYRLRMGKYGRYEVEVEWDQIPHLFSTSGSTLFTRNENGDLQLADGIQQLLANDPSQLSSVADAGRSLSLGTRQDTGRFRFRYTPLPNWDIRLAYSVDRDRGRRSLSTAQFSGLTEPGDAPNPFLASIVELPAPIDFLAHNVETSAEYHGHRWFVRIGETSSFFENSDNRLVWDNPFHTTDELGGGSAGRLTLAPDNQAHSLNAAAGADLPLRGRLTGNFAYGWMRQDDDFQASTVNGAIAVPTLPRDSLDGEMRTMLAHVLVSMRPHEVVTLNARYRMYDLDNASPSITFDDYVVADATRGILRRSLPYAYSRQTAGADVIVRPFSFGSLKTTAQWERLHREHREVRDSDEYRVGPSLDITPMRGVLVRASYAHADRDPRDYDAMAGRESGSRAYYNPLLRKFDEARRIRDQVSSLTRVTVLPQVSVTGTVDYAADDFVNSTYGLLDDDNLSFSAQVAAAPVEVVTLHADYTREIHRFTQEVGMGPLGKAAFHGRGHDTFDTWGAGAQAVLVPEKLDLDTTYSISLGVGRLKAHSEDGGASAPDYPNVDTKLHQFSLLLSYKLTKQLTAKLGYAFERYETDDFASQSMESVLPSADGPKDEVRPPSLYLGARTPDGDYNAHVGTIALRYHF